MIDAGADELYCGYLSPEWVKRYTSLEFERKGGGSNFTDLKELRQAVDLAHKERCQGDNCYHPEVLFGKKQI